MEYRFYRYENAIAVLTYHKVRYTMYRSYQKALDSFLDYSWEYREVDCVTAINTWNQEPLLKITEKSHPEYFI
jgi:hypothetical protein